MKKLLLTLGTLASVAAPVAAVVACGATNPDAGNSDGSKGAAALFQERKDADIAQIKQSTLTPEEQKTAVAKIQAAKTVTELQVTFLNLNLKQKPLTGAALVAQQSAQKAKEAQFEAKATALKAKINGSALDRAVQVTLVGQVTSATVQKTLDAIEDDFNKKVAELSSLPKTKADAEATINALANLNEASKKGYIVRIHNAQSAQVVKTILTGASFEDKKGPQIKAADHSTQATALEIQLISGDAGVATVLNTKAISGSIFVHIKDVKVTVTKDVDSTTFTPAPNIASNTFEVTKEAFANFEATIDSIKVYYDDPANALSGTGAPAKAVAFDAATAIENIKHTIGINLATWRIKGNPANAVQKTKFLEEADKITTQADFDALEAKVNAFKILPPATATVDYEKKAEDAWTAADANYEDYDSSLSRLESGAYAVTDEASYNEYVAKIAAAKK